MSTIKHSYLILIGLLTTLWLIADPILSIDYNFFALRASMMNYTGIIGIGVMSVAMILAIRPAVFESLLGGLDKSYRLHKWLGITGLVISIIHYLWANVPKWLVGLGMIDKPVRQRPPEETIEILQFFQSQRGLAESIGEWSFYAAAILMILALVKWFPYRYFFKTHRLIAITYLFLVFHSVVLMKFSYWGEIIGPLMILLMAGGSVGALFSLFRKIGYKHHSMTEIENLEYFTDNQVLKVSLKLKGNWPGHNAGQFAFLTFDKSEGPHPFTISSAWKNDGKISFLIKGLGDYTQKLPDKLKISDTVNIEGPYGNFDFHSDKSRQIWVAGGIGITPFISKIQDLIDQKYNQKIDLFYSTRMPDDQFIEKVKKDSKLANIRLHLILPEKDGRVDTDLICRTVPDWINSDIWFCGPAAFGQSIKNGFNKLGLPSVDFHQELFEMR